MNRISAVLSSIAGIALLATGVSLPAHASEPSPVTVNGKRLDGAKLSSNVFTVNVSAPAGTEEVTFVLDGKYLGKDTTAPYSFDISTTKEEHKLRTRVESPSSKSTINSEFSTGSTIKPPTPTPTPTPTTPPTPTPTPTPTTPPTDSTVTVSTSAQLTSALSAAKPGTTILLLDGTYTGAFVASKDGTESSPITLTGSSKAILTTGSIDKGYGLGITGDYWVIKGITVKTAAKGIVLDGSVGTVIDGVDVGFTGDEGVHFRKGSSNGKIINSVIHDTGLKSPSYGEGVYIGSAKSNWKSIMGSSSKPDPSNNVIVQNNHIYNTTTEGVDVKEGTTGGSIIGNTFTNSGFSGENYGDSWVDVKGNGYTISGNTGSGTLLDAFQVHKALTGWGNNNTFSNNTATGGVPGYLVNVQSGVTGTVVVCQSTAAVKGISNIGCIA